MRQGKHRRLAVLGVVLATALGIVAPAVANDPGGDLPIDPQWLANTLQRATTTTSVQNNTIPGAIQRRVVVRDVGAVLALGKPPLVVHEPACAGQRIAGRRRVRRSPAGGVRGAEDQADEDRHRETAAHLRSG